MVGCVSNGQGEVVALLAGPTGVALLLFLLALASVVGVVGEVHRQIHMLSRVTKTYLLKELDRGLVAGFGVYQHHAGVVLDKQFGEALDEFASDASACLVLVHAQPQQVAVGPGAAPLLDQRAERKADDLAFKLCNQTSVGVGQIEA